MRANYSIFHSDWQRMTLFVTASLSPAVLALLLSLLIPVTPFDEPTPDLHPVTMRSAQQLEALFDSIDYSWPPQQEVPALEITRIPVDMAELEVKRKKELFLRTLLPLVLAENARLRTERRWLESVMSDGDGNSTAQLRLHRMAEEYGLDVDSHDPGRLIELLYERVDELPVALVLAQAANESGWGTSRFSREVNNLFGEWTYTATHGVLPARRKEGASHFVRSFADLRSSVRSYMHNINRNRAYEPLRELRTQLRSEGHELDPLLLAGGLVRYSARGEEYVAEIQLMIRNDGLNALGPLRLVRLATAG
jgi:Bax protein